jgi:hypothetical protein
MREDRELLRAVIGPGTEVKAFPRTLQRQCVSKLRPEMTTAVGSVGLRHASEDASELVAVHQ